jgi:hypothetical protein
VNRLRSSAPVAVLVAGCALLGAGVAGVARVDRPLQAAAEQQAPAVKPDVDVSWHHRYGDCPPDGAPAAKRAERT